MKIHTLLCRRDLAMGLRCLASLMRHAREADGLVVHDDGTLGPEETTAISGAIPGSRIISKAEADERVLGQLSAWPACQSFRRSHVLAPKLFDLFLLGDEAEVTFCDSDILFFRPFRGLAAALDDADAVFMRDIADQLAWRSWSILLGGRRLTSMLNSGFFRVKRAVHDPGLLEWYLRRAAPDILRHFAEQTAWAFLCGKARTRFWHPAQIRLAHPSTGVTAGTVALHYVGPYRDRLAAPADEAGDGGPEVSLRSVPAPSIGGLGALAGEANRVLRRLRGLGPYADEPYRGLLEIGDGEN